MAEIRELMHLVALDEYRHFGRAAKAMGVSQPAMTKSLQRLERAFGITLFDRSRARVTPTAAGELAITEAKRVLSAAGEMQRMVQLLRGADLGTLRLGLGPAMAESFATEAIARMIEEHPGVQIGLRVADWRELIEVMLAEEIDVSIADMAEIDGDPRLHCLPLPAEKLLWFCRAGHPLANRESVCRLDMLDYPLATPRMPSWAREWFASVTGAASNPRRPRPFPAVECENYAVLKRIVLSSDSISAALRGTIQREVEDESLVVLPLRAPELTTHAGVVWLRKRAVSPLAEKLIAIVRTLAAERAGEAGQASARPLHAEGDGSGH